MGGNDIELGLNEARRPSVRELADGMAFVDQALEQHRDGVEVTAEHPGTGERLAVIEDRTLGFVTVGTDNLGAFFRMRLAGTDVPVRENEEART